MKRKDVYLEVIMKQDSRRNAGNQLLLDRYREVFRIPENLNYYSKTDYEIDEKKFLRYALWER